MPCQLVLARRRTRARTMIAGAAAVACGAACEPVRELCYVDADAMADATAGGEPDGSSGARDGGLDALPGLDAARGRG